MGGLDVVQDILRTITFFLDDKIYGLITSVYELFMYLSQIDLLSGENNPLTYLISRVYVLLGIFMLFKLSFSLLQYMVDPNSFSDSSKGFGKLVTNSLVALVLLIMVPMIFDKGMEIQSVILNENIIPKLILGDGITAGDTNTNTGSEMNVEFVRELAKDTQFMMFGAFYYVDETVLTACDGTPIFGTIGMATNPDCLQALEDGFSEEETIYSSNVQLSDFFKTASADGVVTDRRNFSHFDKLLWWKMNGEYVIKYIPFISTVAGVYVIFMLITFCIDVAVRILKLAFLQAVAPIAIISYVDPKESLSNSKLSNWLKETGKTYVSLFLRLAIIYLILLFISVIANTVLASDNVLNEQISEADSSYPMWIYLFLVMGAFMFAKKVPELLEKIFGMKSTGEFSLNPLKTFANVRDSGFGALAGGAVGLGVGAAASGVAAFAASRDDGAGIGKSLFRGLGGTVGGAFRGTKAGVQSGGKQTLSKALDVAGVAGRNAVLKNNTKPFDRIGAHARQVIGMHSKKEGLDKQIGYHDDVKTHSSNMENRARDQLGKKSYEFQWYEQQRANLQEKAKKEEQLLWRQTDANGNYVRDANGNYIEQMVDSNDSRYSEAFGQRMRDVQENQDRMIADYVNSGGRIQNGNDVIQDSDYQIGLEKETMHRGIKENGLDYMRDSNGNLRDVAQWSWSEIKKAGKAAEQKSTQIKNSDEYQNSETIDQMQKSGIMQSHFGSKH